MSDIRKQVFELLEYALKETKALCMEKRETNDNDILEKIKDLAIKAIIGNLCVELFLVKHSYEETAKEDTTQEDTTQEESVLQEYINKLNEITKKFTSLKTEVNEVNNIQDMSSLKEKIMTATLELAKDNYYKYMDIDDFIKNLDYILENKKTILQEKYEKERANQKTNPEIRGCNHEMIPKYGLKIHAINAINERKDELVKKNRTDLIEKLNLNKVSTANNQATANNPETTGNTNYYGDELDILFQGEGGRNIKKYRRKTKKVKKKNKQMSKKRRH